MSTHKVIVCTGGRTYNNADVVCEALDRIAPTHVHVGDAQGADAGVASWCIIHGIPYTRHTALWQVHGRKAGPLRNQAMIDKAKREGAETLLAFPGGPGTADCIRRAEAAMFRVVRCGDWADRL